MEKHVSASLRKVVPSVGATVERSLTRCVQIGDLANADLVAATRQLVLDERRITAEILAHINEVARSRET